MRKAILMLILGLLSSMLCLPGAHGQARNQKSRMPVYQDHDGYEVLSVLLNRLSVAWKNETIRIGPQTSSGKGVAGIKAQCVGIPAEFQAASQDFDKKAQTRFLLRRGFSLRKKYELGYASPRIAADQPRSKEEDRKRIRSGTYYLAAVGFDEKRTRAVAFVEYICGSLCGDSLFYYLRKSEKGWEEDREVPRKIQSCGQIY